MGKPKCEIRSGSPDGDVGFRALGLDGGTSCVLNKTVQARRWLGHQGCIKFGKRLLDPTYSSKGVADAFFADGSQFIAF
jgi:hypothetical protein